MSMPSAHIGQVSPERACELLHSSPHGLDPQEVAERFAHLGANSFEVVDRWKLARALGRQFTNFFAILLFVSGALCFVAHRINPASASTRRLVQNREAFTVNLKPSGVAAAHLAKVCGFWLE